MKTKTFLFLLLLPTFAKSQWFNTTLPNPTAQMGSAALEDDHTFWFAGGGDNLNFLTDDVAIYHAETGNWTSKHISLARGYATGIAHASLVFFAGGVTVNNQPTNRIDIWDNQMSLWSTAELSVPRYLMSAVAAKGKVLFAGGVNFGTQQFFDEVDIYDVATQIWSTASLSIPRTGMGAVVVETPAGTVAMFAGGTTGVGETTNRIDIYNFDTGDWSIDSMPSSRGQIGAATAGGKAFFAGGMTGLNSPSSVVDVYDPQSDTWTQTSLSVARALPNFGASACDKVIFAGGGFANINTFFWDSASDVIDIYDVNTGFWSTSTLPEEVISHSVVSDGKNILIAGGFNFDMVVDDVVIYTCPASSVSHLPSTKQTLRLFPNPTTGTVYVETKNYGPGQLVRLVNMRGEVVFTSEWNGSDKFIQLPEQIPSGVYTLVVGRETGRLVKE